MGSVLDSCTQNKFTIKPQIYNLLASCSSTEVIKFWPTILSALNTKEKKCHRITKLNIDEYSYKVTAL